ncbi:MAG TPA: FAD-binding oxidoreductase, partial [Chloroflexota bacterium]|nr:FAD-binding oxidoreductase [Chloroflexota bacterium]
LPTLKRQALVHGHCHHKSVLEMGSDLKLLGRLWLEYRELDSGCCGMAGAFGFESNHHDVAEKVGERVLLPAVRSAPIDSLIVADGFSCREQIAQDTDRQALHLAQVIQMALREGPGGARGGAAERGYVEKPAGTLIPAIGLAAAGVAVSVATAWRRRR